MECISKGKAHKRYEFGCKVAMVTTSRENWIVGIDALHGNPYDGHTFKQSMEQAERITGQKPEQTYCDKGYRGAADVPGTTLHLTNKRKKSLTRSQWRWLRRRSAIEPVFGHLKSDNGLERNHLRIPVEVSTCSGFWFPVIPILCFQHFHRSVSDASLYRK